MEESDTVCKERGGRESSTELYITFLSNGLLFCLKMEEERHSETSANIQSQ
jgi:hypothetical protein